MTKLVDTIYWAMDARSNLSKLAKYFSDETAARDCWNRCAGRTVPTARIAARPSTVYRDAEVAQQEARTPRPAPLPRLQQAVHRHRRAPCLRIRTSRCKVAPRDPPAVRIEEGHERPSASPDARDHLQGRVVHGAPSPLRDEQSHWRNCSPGIVEVDETYVGAQDKRGTRRGRPGPDRHKTPVVALVERGGRVRAFPMPRVTAENLGRDGRARRPDATMMTDESPLYPLGRARHEARTTRQARRRGIRARQRPHEHGRRVLLAPEARHQRLYHHVGRGHLERYCDEFAFRYDHRKVSDGERAACGGRGRQAADLQAASSQLGRLQRAFWWKAWTRGEDGAAAAWPADNGPPSPPPLGGMWWR